MSLSDVSKPVRHDPDQLSYRQWWAAEMRRRGQRLRRIYELDADSRRATLAADYWMCREHPQYWMENYGWMIAPKAAEEEEREVPMVLFDKQVELLGLLERSLSEDPPLGIVDSFPVVLNKAREFGATWICMHMSYWIWRFWKLSSVKMLSRKEALVDDRTVDSLFGKIRYLHGRQPHHLREREVDDVFLRWGNPRNKSEIIGEATNEGAGRGGRKTLIIFDEYAHVPPRVAAAAYMSCESVAKAIWLPSTPNGKANKFFELRESLPTECYFEMDWREHPYRDEAWKKGKLLTLTQGEFEQEYECSFSATKVGKVWTVNRSAIEYDEEDSEWVRKREQARRAWWHVGGWDFGSGPSATVCLFAVIEKHEDDPIPTIWVDDELVWLRTDAHIVAQDALQKMRNYSPSFNAHWGDPAGKQKDSEQMSWDERLRANRVPLQMLPDAFNTRDGIDWMIKQAQWLLDSSKMRVHTRCRATWEAIEEWRYDIPEGVPIELISKEYIGPRKDSKSHPANALMYLVGAVCAYFMTKDSNKELLETAKSLPHSASGNLGRLLGASRMA
jgi:hypothetical protein